MIAWVLRSLSRLLWFQPLPLSNRKGNIRTRDFERVFDVCQRVKICRAETDFETPVDDGDRRGNRAACPNFSLHARCHFNVVGKRHSVREYGDFKGINGFVAGQSIRYIHMFVYNSGSLFLGPVA